MKKVIAFSLWGTDPKYLVGAVKNTELAPVIYPGWEVRVFAGKDVPEATLVELTEKGAEVFVVDEPCGWTSTFWRFYPVFDETVDVLISRDADSRLNLREKAAVDEWLASDKNFHIMRDHPAHTTEILAGMWGAKKAAFGAFEVMKTYTRLENEKQADQIFLKEVYKQIEWTAFVHDPFFSNKPFPTVRSEPTEFVGQVFDEHDVPNQLYGSSLAADVRSKC